MPFMRIRISMIAGLLAVVLITILVGFSPAQAASVPTADNVRRALIVGVTDYAGKTTSTAAGAADADDFERVLLNNGFAPGNIVKLTEGRATAANIRGGLQWLADNSNENTFSVFHFSGHVKQMGGDRDRDGEKVDEFLWPHDNKFIADGELANRMRSMRGLTWIDIAGCEGAGFDDGISSPSRLFTASSRETEKSYEYPPWNNSVFTGLEIDEAFLQGKGDRDGNGKVSIQEAFAHAHERAPQMTSRQKKGPQNPVSAGGSGPEWFLNGPPPPPPPPPSDGGSQPPQECFIICI
jgi:hypothetical protein